MTAKEWVDAFNKWSPETDGPNPGEYDVIPKLPPQRAQKKGAICGECGMIFEYGKAYGYCCMSDRCPTQFRTR